MTTQRWDRVGYGLLALFGASGFDDPDYFTFLMIFTVIALVIWMAVDSRFDTTADKPE